MKGLSETCGCAAGASAGSAAVGVSLVVTFSFGASGGEMRVIVSQLMVSSAILAAERPQQPALAGMQATARLASANAPNHAIRTGFIMGNFLRRAPPGPSLRWRLYDYRDNGEQPRPCPGLSFRPPA